MSRLTYTAADMRKVSTMVPKVEPAEADRIEVGHRVAVGLAREAFPMGPYGAGRHLRRAAILRRHLKRATD